MTDFIISEDELDTLDNMDQNDFIIGMLEVIRSRPLSEELKKERERVLDLIQDHNDGRLKGLENLFATPSNERTLSAQDVYLNEAYFELGLVKHLIESLRG